MAKIGDFIKIGFVIAILLGIGWLFVSSQYDIPTTDELLNTTEELSDSISQCVDGIDNDGDGFTDYLEDNDCDGKSDNSERSYSFLKWLLGGMLGGGIVLFIIYRAYFKREKDSDNPFKEPIGNDRATILAKSWFIKEYIDDMWCEPLSQKEHEIQVPCNKKDIKIYDRFKHIENQEYFQFVFFRVMVGEMCGDHVMAYSLSRGEEHILGGVDKCELNKPRVYWETLKRTFKMSSIDDKQERMLSYLSENASTEEEYNDILRSTIKNTNNTQRNATDDMDDAEYSVYRSELAKANMKSPKKKKKASSSPITTPAETPTEGQ